MSTPGSRPRPALIWVIRCLGVAPPVPNATMWLPSAEAPALVPATIAPARCRAAIARPSRVPAMTLDRRSWLPPVMKMPLASAMVSTTPASSASSRVNGRSARTSVTPMAWNSET